MADTLLPPIPQRVQLTDERGYVSQPWSKWFLFIFERAGGTIAPSNDSLDLTSVISDVTSLQTLTSTHTLQIAALQSDINDLKQGPVL